MIKKILFRFFASLFLVMFFIGVIIGTFLALTSLGLSEPFSVLCIGLALCSTILWFALNEGLGDE